MEQYQHQYAVHDPNAGYGGAQYDQDSGDDATEGHMGYAGQPQWATMQPEPEAQEEPKSKKRHKRRKKDPNAPKNPMSAYMVGCALLPSAVLRGVPRPFFLFCACAPYLRPCQWVRTY